MMNRLSDALYDSFRVTLDSTDKVEFLHNYEEDTIVDVVVTDTRTNETIKFEMFDTTLGIFIY